MRLDGKSYMDLALASGGFFCDDTNSKDCDGILNAPQYTREWLSRISKNEHVKMIKQGQAKMLPWGDYNEMKQEL